MKDKWFLSFTKACYKDRFLFLIIFIVALIVLGPFIGGYIQLRLFMNLFFSIIFVITIYAVSQKRLHIIIAVVLLIPTLLAVWTPDIPVNNTLLTIGYICGLVVFAFAVISILNYIDFIVNGYFWVNNLLQMKYDPINSALFVKNRKKFMAAMKPKSVAVFNSNDIYPISADSTMPFQQHRDILYLSGVDQEESILLLFPDASNPENKEVLFVRETNDHIAVWEGEKLTKEKATQVSGIHNVQWLSNFDKVFFDVMTESETIYFNTNEHYRQAVETQTREDRFIERCKQKFPGHMAAKSNPILQRIRGVKEAEEIAVEVPEEIVENVKIVTNFS